MKLGIRLTFFGPKAVFCFSYVSEEGVDLYLDNYSMSPHKHSQSHPGTSVHPVRTTGQQARRLLQQGTATDRQRSLRFVLNTMFSQAWHSG